MFKTQWKLMSSYAFIVSIIGGLYAITQTPLPKIDLAIWGVIFGGWALVWKSPLFAQWRPDLQQLYRAAFILILIMLPIYFLVRLAGVPIAIGVVGLIALYIGLFQIVGMLLIGNRRYETAYRYLDTMIKFFPRRAQLYTQKAYGHLLEEKFGQTIQFATQAIDLTLAARKKTGKKGAFDAWALQAYNLRVMAYLNQRDGINALPDANLLVRATPQDPQAYINRGVAQVYADDLAAAQADLEYAIEIAVIPYQRFLAEDTLGLVFYCLGNNASAMIHYIKALQVSLPPMQRSEFVPRTYVAMASVHFMQNDMQFAQQMKSIPNHSIHASVKQ